MNMEEKKIKRVAIYTRKSTDEGLDMEFNSLDAQREAAEAYVISQKSKGWMCLPERYDDGGFSDGTTERPALKRLLDDVKTGKIDVVCVYKIDRLSRSLRDFLNLLDFFESKDVVFVSVTQEVNTSTSAGRMNLNIVISFAQYEREIIGERIRDKIAAAKKRGMNTGGFPPMGYESDPMTKKYIIVPEEAECVRKIFDTYLKLGSARDTAEELTQAGYCKRIRTSRRSGIHYGGGRLTPGYVYSMLNNPIYIGCVRHYEKVYPGEHEAIISKDIWDKTQSLLKMNRPPQCRFPASERITPLKGIVRCGYCNCAMKQTYTKKEQSRSYRYLICDADSKRVKHTCPLRRIPEADLEEIVLEDIKLTLSKPDIIFGILSEAKSQSESGSNLTAGQVRKAFVDLNAVWKVMYPVERYKLIQTIIKKITVFRDQVKIEYNGKAINGLVKE